MKKNVYFLLISLISVLLAVSCASAGGSGKTVISVKASQATLVTKKALVLENDKKNIGYWSDIDDQIKWNIEVTEPGTYKVIIHYSVLPLFEGSTVKITVGSNVLEWKMTGTVDWFTYRKKEIGNVSLGQGIVPVVIQAKTIKSQYVGNISRVDFIKQDSPAVSVAASAASRDQITGTKISVTARQAKLVTKKEMVFEDANQNIGWWSDIDDKAMWDIQVAKPGTYKVIIDYSVIPMYANSVVNVTVGNNVLEWKVKSTGDWGRYQKAEAGTVALASGQVPVMLQAKSISERFVANVRSIDFILLKPATDSGSATVTTSAGNTASFTGSSLQANTDREDERIGLPVITVFDFAFEGISKMEAEVLVDMLSGALLNTGKFRIIDRTQRQVLLDEIEFSLSGCTDESCQLEVGKLLSADYMVIGGLGKVGTRFVINTKLIEIESGETRATVQNLYANVDAMLDGCAVLVNKLMGQ
ncbi:MAG: hypothetical protein JW874_04025 [Spirochaetales bacterium]|nr:hypothetical protein [Spirochaetales bacterium]